jgi:hypothetical protein
MRKRPPTFGTGGNVPWIINAHRVWKVSCLSTIVALLASKRPSAARSAGRCCSMHSPRTDATYALIYQIGPLGVVALSPPG